MNKDIKVNYHPVLNMYDMSTPEKAVGAVDYVFVAKLILSKKLYIVIMNHTQCTT